MENKENQPENEPITHSNVLAKPLLVEDKSNWVRKSLISLAIYGVLFIVIFDMNITYAAAVLVALLIHEFGHFFAMKLFNYNNVKLFIIPLLGAYVSGTKSNISQRHLTIVILTGPVPGIIIGFCLMVYNIYMPNEKLMQLGQIFMFLNLFNLLPFMPLDGGRLLEILFVKHNYILKVVFSIISIIGLIVICIFLKSYFLIIIPVSMVFELVSEYRNQKIRNYLNQENINYIVDYENLPNKDYWTIRDCILFSFQKRYSGIKPGEHTYSIIESSLLKHVSAILKTPYIMNVNLLEKMSIIITYLFFLIGLPIMYFFLISQR